MPLYGRSESFWYQAPEGEVYTCVFPHVEAIDQDQSDVRVSNRYFARLYSNRYEPGLEQGRRGAYRNGFLTVTENLVKSVVDTSVSLVAKSKPKVAVLTDNGDWELQRLARKLDRYLLDQFRYQNVYEKMSLLYRDASIFGTGVLKFCLKHGEVYCERVLIDEIVVDENEIPYGGCPLQLHQVRPVSAEKLKVMFPEHEEHIKKASDTTSTRFHEYRQVDPGMVMVVESWRPSPAPGTPGRHTICISTADLHDEEYGYSDYPFVFYHYSPPLTGFYGQGLAEDLLDNQIRQNELNDFARKAFDLVSVPRVFVEHGTKIIKPSLSNEIGQVIPYVGKPPVFFTPTSLTGEFFTLHEQNRESAFAKAGISRMAAQAVKPPGIEAGVALRELSDNQAQRLSDQQARYENAHIDVGRMMCRFSIELADGAKPKREFSAKNLFEQIDWPAVEEAKLNLRFNVQASSSLNDTPAARKQTAIEFAQYGVPVRPDEIRRLINHPDLELSDKRATAALENVEWLIGELLDGRYHPPQPFQDLALGIERVTAAYLDAWANGAPEDLLDGFRTWVTAADELIKASQPQPMPGMMPAEAGQPGASPLGDIPGDVIQDEALAGLFRQ